MCGLGDKNMWSYYGRKKKIIKKYPQPIYDLIIEPFAGSASYAYQYWEKDIILIDGYETVVKIWKYLQQAKPEDILRLPNVGVMENIDKYNYLADEEKWLMGYCINNGSTIPKHTARHGNFNSWNRDKIRIANDLYKIKHWKIFLGEYCSQDNNIKNNATWFIDPPYQNNIYKYGYNKKIDYSYLGRWCKDKLGQVIVCDDSTANWLPFEPLIEMAGQRKKSKEFMWYQECSIL
jgi:hypothetical protein